MSFPFNLWFEVNVETLEILTLHLSYQGTSTLTLCHCFTVIKS